MSGTTSPDTGTGGSDRRESSGNNGAGNESASVEELEAHIEQTRQELGETVDALSAKLNVKTRMRNQVASSKERAGVQLRRTQEAMTDPDGSLKTVVPVTGGGVALLVVGALAFSVVRRRRRRSALVLGRRR